MCLESLTNCEFFMAAGGVLLLIFIIWTKISLILYRGYIRTEREAHYRRRLSSGLHMSRSNTFPPTLVWISQIQNKYCQVSWSDSLYPMYIWVPVYVEVIHMNEDMFQARWVVRLDVLFILIFEVLLRNKQDCVGKQSHNKVVYLKIHAFSKTSQPK